MSRIVWLGGAGVLLALVACKDKDAFEVKPTTYEIRVPDAAPTSLPTFQANCLAMDDTCRKRAKEMCSRLNQIIAWQYNNAWYPEDVIKDKPGYLQFGCFKDQVNH